MKKSLKQIIDKIEDFAENHKGIKQFESKPLSDYTSNDYLYPLMWVQLKGMKYAYGEAQISLDIYFVDRLKPNYDNFIKVVSDTLKLCDDFTSNFIEYEEDYDFYFSNENNITPVEYAFEDNVAGNKIEVTVQVILNRDKNEIAI